MVVFFLCQWGFVPKELQRLCVSQLDVVHRLRVRTSSRNAKLEQIGVESGVKIRRTFQLIIKRQQFPSGDRNAFLHVTTRDHDLLVILKHKIQLAGHGWIPTRTTRAREVPIPRVLADRLVVWSLEGVRVRNFVPDRDGGASHQHNNPAFLIPGVIAIPKTIVIHPRKGHVQLSDIIPLEF